MSIQPSTSPSIYAEGISPVEAWVAQTQQFHAQRATHRRLDVQLTVARESLQALRSNEPSTRVDLDRAASDLRRASGRLGGAVAAVDLNSISGAVLSVELSAKHLSFVRDEIDRLRSGVQQHANAAEQHQAAAPPAREALAAAVQLAEHALHAAQVEHAMQQHTHASVESDLVVVGHQKAQMALSLEAVPGGDSPEHHVQAQELEDQLAHFDRIEHELRALVGETRSLLDVAAGHVDEAVATLAELHAQVAELDLKGPPLEAAGAEAPQALQALEAVATAVAPKLEQATAVLEAAKAPAEAVETAVVQAMLLRPPGFKPSLAREALGVSMLDAVRNLPPRPAADALPLKDVAEALSLSLSRVTDGDAGRAHAVLTELQARSSLSLVTRAPGPNEAGGSSGGASAPSSDLQALLRLMAGKPRGMEVLQTLGANGGEIMSGKQLVALRTYWEADAALDKESDPAVKTWLAGAREVAHDRVHEANDPALDSRLAERFDQRVLGAFNAVRNGYFSNAAGSAYDQHNQGLLKISQEWMDRRLDRYSEGMLKGLMPTRAKSPFTPTALRRTAEMADTFGIKTHAAQAAEAVRAAATELGGMADALLKRPLTVSDHRLNVAVSVLGAYVKENLQSIRPLTTRDFDAMRRQFGQALGTQGQGRASGKQLLPPVLEEAAAEARAGAKTSGRLLGNPKSKVGVPVDSVVRDVIEEFLRRNQAILTPEDKVKLGAGLGLEAEAATDNFRLSHVNRLGQTTGVRLDGKKDLLKFYQPMLSEWNLRDKLKTAIGGTLGGGIPFVPFAPLLPKVLTVAASVGYAQKQEAFVQFFQPILGVEFMAGEQKTHSFEASAGARVGPPGKWLNAGGGVTLGAAHERVANEGMVVRFVRARGQDAAQRANMQTAFESVVMWDQLKPTNSTAGFAGPLEALLSRSPDAVATGFKGGSISTQVELRANAGVQVQAKADSRGARHGAGTVARVVGKAQKAVEFRDEDRAAVYIVNDKASIGKQALTASVELRLPLASNTKTAPVKSGDGKKIGSVGGGSVPLGLTFERELLQHYQKHGLSPFRINDKQDGDLDRHYLGAKEMLAEIAANREQWLARGLETMPEVNGTNDTPANRAEVERLLDRFQQDILEIEKENKLSQFNVNYSMRPKASARIDGARLVGELAAELGDSARVADRLKGVDEVLQQATTWRPLMLIVREKGKEQIQLGLNYGVRAQKVDTTEGQRTAAQFPPP